MIRIELFGGRSPEQKVACARDIVAAVTRHLGAPAEATQVMFVDVDKADWLFGAKLPPPAENR